MPYYSIDIKRYEDKEEFESQTPSIKFNVFGQYIENMKALSDTLLKMLLDYDFKVEGFSGLSQDKGAK